jgi:hypothetical protein
MFSNMIKKVINLLILAFVLLTINVTPVSAAVAAPPAGGSTTCVNPLTTECDNPQSECYGSRACIKQKLGLDNIDESIFVKANPISAIVVFFQILLAVVIILVVYRIVVAGMTIANAGDDADKRKAGFVKMINAIIGLIVAFSSLGITMLINSAFGIKVDEGILTECANIAVQQGTDSAAYTACVQNLSNSPTP